MRVQRTAIGLVAPPPRVPRFVETQKRSARRPKRPAYLTREDWIALYRYAVAREPEIAQAFLDAIRSAEVQVSGTELVAAIRTGSVDRALVQLIHDPRLERLLTRLGDIRLKAGRDVWQTLRLKGSFNLANPLAAAFAKREAGRLISAVGVSQSARLQIRAAIVEAIKSGTSVDALAKTLRGMIGLNAPQLRALRALRATLMAQGITGNALERKLQRAAEKALKYRARMIARTETLRAANYGQLIAWKEAQLKGLLSARAKKIWIATPDERTCQLCADMDGEEVLIGHDFSIGVEAPPVHVQCRCTIVTDAGDTLV